MELYSSKILEIISFATTLYTIKKQNKRYESKSILLFY